MVRVLDEPTQDNFYYTYKNAPLYFTEIPEHGQQCWKRSLTAITREYFRVTRTYDICAQTPLSNGQSAGEFAMFMIRESHNKRLKQQRHKQKRQKKSTLITT